MGIALQLYSIREDCSRNLEASLKAVAEMGYEGVEFAGYYGKSAEELREILDKLGLKVAGTHTALDTLLEEKLGETVEFNRILENRFLIVPWLPEDRLNTVPKCLEIAGLLNDIAKKVKKEGMRVGYHNHAFEFKTVNGNRIWDLLFDSTIPDVVMQLDTGNAMHGGASVEEILSIIRKYPGRAVTVHVKEYSSNNPNALIGEGEMKWREFFETCRKIGGTEWFIVEQESYAYPPLECVKRCLENLKKMKLVL